MKKKIVIFGEVHNVGYRPPLLGIAESLEIERFFADNIKIDGKDAVYVLVDSSDEKVEEFIKMVRSKQPDNAKVEEVTIEDYSGSVMKIDNYYRYLTSAQLGKIATYGRWMVEKQIEMLNKQDLTIAEIKATRDELKEEIRGVSSRLDKTNTLLEDRFRNLEEEIEKIKKALIKAGIEV